VRRAERDRRLQRLRVDVVLVRQQVAVERERRPGETRELLLEGGVARRVHAGVVVGEPVDDVVVARGIADQARRPEVDAAGARVEQLAHLGVAQPGPPARERDLHLHRPRRRDGVQRVDADDGDDRRRQLRRDRVAEQAVEVALGAQRADARAQVAVEDDVQRRLREPPEPRELLLQRFHDDARQVRHDRIGLVPGLLLDDGDDGAGALGGRLLAGGADRRDDVLRPPGAIHRPHADQLRHGALVERRRRRRGRPLRARRDEARGQDGHDGTSGRAHLVLIPREARAVRLPRRGAAAGSRCRARPRRRSRRPRARRASPGRRRRLPA
jgi:hypothetical protein